MTDPTFCAVQLTHCHLDPQRRLVYVSIPKNACTTIKSWFLTNLGVDVEPFRGRGGEIHNFARRHHNLAVLDEAEAKRWLDEAFVFAFLREPIGRVVSGYLNKFVTARRKGEAINFSSKDALEAVHRQRGQAVRYDREHAMSWGGHVLKLDSSIDYERGLTVREFVDYLCGASDDMALNPHWRPQHRFIDGLRVDFLGRVETLAADMAGLCERVGLPAPAMPAENRTAYAAPDVEASPEELADALPETLAAMEALPRTSQLLPEDLRARLEERYRQDIALYAQLTPAA
jgi:hypothetical protein